MNYKLRYYTQSDTSSWDDFVLKHKDGTFFHLSGWKRVIEKTFGHTAYYLILEKAEETAALDTAAENKFAGVFPLFMVKSIIFGRSMVSLPFATFGGILADSRRSAEALYEEAVRLTRYKNLDYLEIRNEKPLFNDLPTKDLYYNFKKEIFPDDEDNLKAIPRKARRMIRVGMKKGLQARFGAFDLLDEFYDLFAFNYRELGTPVFPKKYLKNLLEEFRDSSSVLIISKDGAPLSGVLSFYFQDQVIPYYSGAYPASRKLAANDYLYWALMSDAAERGFRIFDFGRSKKGTGPFHFKRHWGFEPKQLAYQYYLNKIAEMPNISPNNPKYRRGIELWRKMPLPLTKIIGPQIIKYIP